VISGLSFLASAGFNEKIPFLRPGVLALSNGCWWKKFPRMHVSRHVTDVIKEIPMYSYVYKFKYYPMSTLLMSVLIGDFGI